MNNLKEHDYAMSAEQYSMLMGGYKAGNYPKEIVNEAAAQIHKLSVALNQHKEDLSEQELITNLMAVDLANMREKFIHYSKSSTCVTVQLVCSLVVMDIDKILKNQQIDFNKLIA